MSTFISGADRGVSPALGVVLLVVIVILLAVTAGVTFYSLAEEGEESAAVHGMGAYEFNYDRGSGILTVRPESIQTRQTTFSLYVNGQKAREWNGKAKLDITCLYPNDRVRIVTEKGSTTNLLAESTLERPLSCDLGLTDRFKYVKVDGDKIEIGSRYNFDLAIDPDRPGPDGTYGNDVDTKNVGPVPLSNPWHYSKQYPGPINGLGPGDKPVYVFIMADNVHWDTAPSWDGGRNWTDPVPTGRTPGQGNYEISSGNLEAKPSAGAGEPTNDVYMLFEPGCDESRILIVQEQAGYDNQILLDGEVAVQSTDNATDGGLGDADDIIEANPIPCFEG